MSEVIGPISAESWRTLIELRRCMKMYQTKIAKGVNTFSNTLSLRSTRDIYKNFWNEDIRKAS